VVPDARPAVGDEEDAQRRNSSLTRWGVELVVLVTWHDDDLEPLLLLFPLELVSFVVYLKGNLRSCEALPADMLRRLAACVPEPRGEGVARSTEPVACAEPEDCASGDAEAG